MDRRKFINASALTSAGLIVSPLIKGENSAEKTAGIDKSIEIQTKTQTIGIPATQIPVVLETDVVVIGGGPAGFGAAMRAARSGLNTLLIERFGGPGGAATSGYMCVIGQGSSFPLHSEWIEGLRKEGWLFDAWKTYPKLNNNVLVHQSGNKSFYPDDGAYVMNEMLEKAKVKLLFCTHFVDTVLKHNLSGDDTIDAIVIENASGKQAIRGKIFIDSTGVADVVVRTGAPYVSAGNGFDASLGQIELRKFNIAEVKFLRKYVPGFENAYQSGMAPYMAIREGRHPQGEYVLTWDDIINERKFPDAVLKRSSGDVMDYGEDIVQSPNEKGEPIWKKPPKTNKRTFTFDIPYRALLPKKINNLLLAGQCISSTNDFFWNSRGIPWAMRTGEVVGEAASMAVKRGITVKEIKWTSGYLTDPIS